METPMSEEAAKEITQTLKGQDAFDLYKQGKAAWNAWSAENTACHVNFSNWDFTEEEYVDFSGFNFPERGDVIFGAARFGKGNVHFNETKFGEGDVSFFGAQFSEGAAVFNNAQFGKGNVSFNYTRFGGEHVQFNETKFGEGDVSFFGAQFGEGDVLFVKAKFGKGNVSFSNIEFGKGNVHFNEAQFGEGNVRFDQATFTGPLYFLRVTTSIDASAPPSFSFSGAAFRSSAVFDLTVFDNVPDFRYSQFGREPSLEGTKVVYNESGGRWKWLHHAAQDDTSKYRRLRRLAIDAKDHDRELEYFSYELRAKFRNPLDIVPYLPIGAYHLISDFGRSVCRPFVCLIFIWVAAAGIFCLKSKKVLQVTTPEGVDSLVADALLLSASNLLPFVAWSKATREAHFGALFGEAGNGAATSLNWVVEITSYCEGISGLILFFLIGLAVRNKLRL
jgi:hypothetical protein